MQLRSEVPVQDSTSVHARTTVDSLDNACPRLVAKYGIQRR